MKINAQELAEGFINGNISWVKGHIKSVNQFVEVLEVIKENYPMEEDNFIRLMKGA